MAMVEVEIAARKYSIACRDGEEDHLRSVAAIVDRKAGEAAQALGNLAESRHLLFTALLLADELKEQMALSGRGSAAGAQPDLSPALERLADRMEALAERVENQGARSYIAV